MNRLWAREVANFIYLSSEVEIVAQTWFCICGMNLKNSGIHEENLIPKVIFVLLQMFLIFVRKKLYLFVVENFIKMNLEIFT
jgi:hypothetical protein